MKLQQLRYLCETARHDMNVSAAANALHTSQPGVSKQIRQLEDELGVQLFFRHGKRLTDVTEAGRGVLRIAERVLQEVDNIKRASEEFSRQERGQLTLATTHTQARYMLPPVIKQFRERYPGVHVILHQGNPTQVAEQILEGSADLALATEALDAYPDVVTLPCYRWNRCVVVPPRHPLLKESMLTLEAIARFPLITYDYSFTGRPEINRAFAARGLEPQIVLSALDSDVIKTYVALGLGVGILAGMAFDPVRDRGLRMLEAGHLFRASTTKFGIRRGTFLRGYVYDFLQMFAPHLTHQGVDAAMSGSGSTFDI